MTNERTPIATIGIEEWAIAVFNQELPEPPDEDFFSAFFSFSWDEVANDEEFCSDYDIRPEYHEAVIEFLTLDSMTALESACYKAWIDAIEYSTERLFESTDPKKYNPFEGSFDAPAMEIPDNFPDLDYEFSGGEIKFYGSFAPIHARMVRALEGRYSFSSISDFLDSFEADGEDGIHAWVHLFGDCSQFSGLDACDIDRKNDWTIDRGLAACRAESPEYFVN